MACTYQAEQVSIPCIIEIINEVRNKSVNATTVRKILKQVDAGIAIFGKPEDISTMSTDLESLANLLEASVTDATAQNGAWLSILIAILKLLLQ